MLGTSEDSKKHLFKIIKKAYNCRSAIVHGQYLKGTEDDLVNISKELDYILRNLITTNHDIFSKKDNEMEEFFLITFFFI